MIPILLAATAALCTPVEGERILARDMARAWPAFASVAAETSLAFAPAPGVRRVFAPAELARLGARYGVGAPPPPVCFEMPAAPLTPKQVLPAMQASLGVREARIEIVELSRCAVPEGEIVFPKEALPSPAPGASGKTPLLWRGEVRYGVRRRAAVWARVTVRAPVVRVYAATELRAKEVVHAGQLREERGEGFPHPALKAVSAAVVAGRKPRRTIPAGAEVRLDMLDEPREVETGDRVEVRVSSGAALLSFTGRSESAGGTGQTVRVRNPESRRSFSARVAGKGVVAVEAGGDKR